MIHYHGTPIWPRAELQKLGGRSFCVPFIQPRDITIAHEIGQSVMLDNGAFTAWTKNIEVDWADYYEWCERWLDYHTTWAVIPDIIDGSEEDNDRLIKEWPHGNRGAPVWHLHESLDRLIRLCGEWPRVCFGSSGVYSDPNSDSWDRRVCEAFDAIAPDGKVPTWIHMLRGLQFAGSGFPFASVDSTHLARNFKRDGGVELMAGFWDSRQCPARWSGRHQGRLDITCSD